MSLIPLMAYFSRIPVKVFCGTTREKEESDTIVILSKAKKYTAAAAPKIMTNMMGMRIIALPFLRLLPMA